MCSYFSGHSYPVGHADLCHLHRDETERMWMFRLSMIDKCSCCLEQSYLLRKNVDVYVHTEICA